MIIPQWPAPNNVNALSTERESPPETYPVGMSLPPYDRFNLGDHVGDRPDYVSFNREQLLNQAIGCDHIRWLQQIHGNECSDAALILDGESVDATFTQKKNLACAVMTADCLPVLFCDLEGTQVAAAHAGWKGLAGGVLEQTLKKFSDNGIAADRIIAWIGPAIGQSAFEVGQDVQQAFMHFKTGAPWADETCFMAGKGDRLQADLYRLATLQLEHLGIAGVYGAQNDWCTYHACREDNSQRFFSYRRESITGRQASLIWLA